MADIEYILGHSKGELRRLELQGRMLECSTRRLLQEAGLQPGWKVLDIGTGNGEVALIAAEIVGRSGSVLGIDPSEVAIAAARKRVANNAFDIKFEVASMADLASDRRFNLAVGRYVLGHQGDQVSFIQDAASCLVSGGTLAFLDVDTDLRAPMYAIPHVPLFEDAVSAANEIWAAMGARINPGSRYHELFFKAGLREPMVIWEHLRASGNAEIVEWLCLILKSISPALAKTNPATAARLDVETLQGRLMDALSAAHSQVSPARVAGAWVTLP
jgi:ubiquinone/menaquinone biosynthesis C-methylase UbiE